MSGAAPGKAAVSASASARPRRKVLSAEEAELFELAQAAGSGLDPEVFKVLLDLLRMNVAPLAVFQVLKSMCAGQRLPAGPDSAPPAAPPADSRDKRSGGNEIHVYDNESQQSNLLREAKGRNKSSSAVSGTQVLIERSGREGSAQRMPRQPSASRLQKAGASGKNSGGNSS